MPNRVLPPMCLSTEEHGNRILDNTKHYFGCLKESARHQFYNDLPEESQQLICLEKLRVERLRSRLESQPETKAGILLDCLKRSINEWRVARGRNPVETSDSPRPLRDSDGGINGEIKASMIFFKNSRPYDIPGVDRTFPNQKIPIKKLLTDDPYSNPLMQPCDNSMIQYFHLPANNMIWVEEVIARYFHEERPADEDLFHRSRLNRTRTKTEMLLAPQFWRGQQLFDDDSEVHARHMRPLCDVISTNPTSIEPLPKNMVLFMPYLHWETDRGRVQSTKAIKVATTVKTSMAEIVARANGARERSSLSNQRSEVQDDVGQRQILTSISTSKAPERGSLGEVFLRAAALMEAIDFRMEESMILEFLHQKPPLHPRRTLDQSYYGKLGHTATRDRDQVVYRATARVDHDCKRNLDERYRRKCKQCQEDIKKVPQLIMVDQLWLWILDEKTVVTSFPRRWSKIRPDPSDVHKSLRMRLKAAREDEIRSAYDLALIIIDECSRVFFDRTKLLDCQPNLVHMFADAIGAVTFKQTAAFDHFLTLANLAAMELRLRDRSVSIAQKKMLNINLEGNLLKEIKDILDEIHILTRVKQQQQTVIESFVKHIKQSLSPQLTSKASWHPMIPFYEDECDPELELMDRETRAAARLTIARADHLLNDVHDRIGELKTLEVTARKTAAALNDTLTLKQQQASVIEAREAVIQAQLTQEQGKVILLFTIVTIVFLPLSFCSSLFGMNTKEFSGGAMSLSQQFAYMFPISAAVVAISFIVGFGRSAMLPSLSTVSKFIISPFSIILAWFLIKSGIYKLGRKMETKANTLREKANKITGAMVAEVMRENAEKKHLKTINLLSVSGADDLPNEGGITNGVEQRRTGRTPLLRPGNFADDIESGQNSRTGSRVRLV